MKTCAGGWEADETRPMVRAEGLAAAQDPGAVWDVAVIGGGASGLGAAVDAAVRGYRVVLLEQSDFAKGTSSRSTKLIHGGVRYLQQCYIGLVLDSLRERGRLMRNAPHLVRRLPFVIPVHGRGEGAFYGLGLKLYDGLSGHRGLGASRRISGEEVVSELPTVATGRLAGGVRYFDAQFDDARLAICLARTLADLGGVAVNYARVAGFVREKGRIRGVIAQDVENGHEWELRARVVVNATGVFADEVRRLDDRDALDLIIPSQGTHIVVDRSFLPGDGALLVPRTADGRVLFAIPWQDRVLIGTTDTQVPEPSLEPRPLAEEIGFLLGEAGQHLARGPGRGDILSMFSGLRPLLKVARSRSTGQLSRDHAIFVSGSGLVTVTGGKWTTYRQMGEDVIARAAAVGELESRPPRTRKLRLHGWCLPAAGAAAGGRCAEPGHWAGYGTDAAAIHALAAAHPGWSDSLHPRLPYCGAEVVWAVREEMARTVEDVLARRTRALLLDARTAIEAAPRVAELMAAELGRDAAWQRAQVEAFSRLAGAYLPG